MGDGARDRGARARRARSRGRGRVHRAARHHRRPARGGRVSRGRAARRRRHRLRSASSPASPTCCARSSPSRSAAPPPKCRERGARGARGAARSHSPRPTCCACCRRSPSSSRASERADSSNCWSRRCSFASRCSIARSSSRSCFARSAVREAPEEALQAAVRHQRGLRRAPHRLRARRHASTRRPHRRRVRRARRVPSVRPPAPRASARADGPAVRAELAAAAPVEIRGQHFELVAVAGADGQLAGVAPLELSKLTARWDAARRSPSRDGKPMLATALAHASPAAVTASGVVTIELDEPNDIYAHAIGTGRAEIARRAARVVRRRGASRPAARREGAGRAAQASHRRNGARRAHRRAHASATRCSTRRSTRSISTSPTDRSRAVRLPRRVRRIAFASSSVAHRCLIS